MDKKLQEDIEGIVKSIFAQKQESEQKDLMSKTLEKSAQTISDLTDALASKDAELAEIKDTMQGDDGVGEELASTKETLGAKITELEEASNKIDSLETEVSELKSKLSASEEEVASMKLEVVVASRMEELESAKVLRSNKEAQAAKIRDMSDEEFASYKEELEELRTTVAKELETSTDKKDESKDSSDDDDTVVLANVADKKESASLNLETRVSSTIKNQYAELGKAMADMFNKSDK